MAALPTEPALTVRPRSYITFTGGATMLKVSESASFARPAKELWRWVGDFGGLAKWHPAVARCELRGDGTRLLTLADGAELVERLERCDEPARTLEYSIVSGPLPVRRYRSRITVTGNDDGCTVEWSSQFDADGADDAQAREIVRGVYTAGLDQLRRLLATR